MLHQLLIINKATYLVVLSRPIFTGPLSSVRANEQMLLSCWSQYDGQCNWQRHPSAERTCEGGSSGRSIACQGALTFLSFLPSFFLIIDLINDIQKSFSPPHQPLHPKQSTPQLFCSSEHSPDVLFRLLLTCNLPLSTTGGAN